MQYSACLLKTGGFFDLLCATWENFEDFYGGEKFFEIENGIVISCGGGAMGQNRALRGVMSNPTDIIQITPGNRLFESNLRNEFESEEPV